MSADLCAFDGKPCYVGATLNDKHHRCGTVQCPRPKEPKPPTGMTCTECFTVTREPMPTGALADLVKITGKWLCARCVRLSNDGVPL